MAQVLGIGGVFIRSKDPAALREWYGRVLGVEMAEWGAIITPEAMAAHPGAATVLSFFPADTDYFTGSTRELMIDLAVDDLDGILARAREHGVEAVRTFDDEPNGRFAHILDPEGTTIELWQPKPMA